MHMHIKHMHALSFMQSVLQLSLEGIKHIAPSVLNNQ